MYALLLVGCGLTNLAAAARWRQLRPGHDGEVAIIDTRPHLAGNAYDYPSRGTRVHLYGPHLFHSPSPRIVEFLSAFTDWDEVVHAVTAEVRIDGRLMRVPFPYSRITAEAIGRGLSGTEVVDAFFRGYSTKMWGQAWEDLPAGVRGRVRTNDDEVPERPIYFPGQFVAVPRAGYTVMAERMAEGAEVILNAGPREWLDISARHVVYTGRPDLLPLPDSPDATLGEAHDLQLPYRTLDVSFRGETWTDATSVLNFCTPDVSHTRKTNQQRLTGGLSELISTETPRDARRDELAPFYPVIADKNREKHGRLKDIVRKHYPNLTLAGRLGTYQYLDMYQAVGQGIAVAERLAGLAT